MVSFVSSWFISLGLFCRVLFGCHEGTFLSLQIVALFMVKALLQIHTRDLKGTLGNTGNKITIPLLPEQCQPSTSLWHTIEESHLSTRLDVCIILKDSSRDGAEEYMACFVLCSEYSGYVALEPKAKERE